MSQYFEVHPDNPQPRLLKQAVQVLHSGEWREPRFNQRAAVT